MNDTLLLTGATGFVGRYVLRELLRNNSAEIVVLVRATNEQHARQRIETVLDWLKIDNQLRQRVQVCVGDLTSPRFGESQAVRDCLHRCTTVIHAAASVSFSNDDSGDPARTNVLGTRQLLEQMGPQLRHWVQISTAYVAPTLDGIGVEREAKQSDFRNDYERTKATAERMVTAKAATRGFALTIARPGIVVGEFDSGRASTFQGFYQPLRAIARLADRAKRTAAGKVRIPLRINIAPQGVRNLVPVDWVARSICELAAQGMVAEGIFHLTPDAASTTREIFDATLAYWEIEGISFHPGLDEQQMTTFERAFYRHLKQIAPYWAGEPSFGSCRRKALLPHLPCPQIDERAIGRLLEHAAEIDWGEQSVSWAAPSVFPSADFLERFLPQFAPLSTLPRLTNVTAEVGFRISGVRGGEWRCRMNQGDVKSVKRAACDDTAVVFETDGDTFSAIVRGDLLPQQAFFDHRIEILGNIEMGLKLAMIFGQFVTEFPYTPEAKGGHRHVAAA